MQNNLSPVVKSQYVPEKEKLLCIMEALFKHHAYTVLLHANKEGRGLRERGRGKDARKVGGAFIIVTVFSL